MPTSDFVPTLGLVTLIAGLLIAVFLLTRFLRKPANRHPMDGQRERNIGEIREEAGKRRETSEL